MKHNKNYLNELTEIQEMAKRLRTVNESIMFAENYEDEYDDMMGGEESDVEPEPDEMGNEGNAPLQQAPVEEPSDEEAGLREMGSEVDQIREIALKGMIKLCHTTEDPAYEALKKIFQFCDKANEKKDEPAK